MFENLLLTREGAVAVLTVNRPTVLNALNSQTLDELGAKILICGREEMIERLSVYAEIGIDEVLTTSNFGQDEQMTLDMMGRFAEEVMPHFAKQKKKAA